jgi:hypothetical protein
MNETHRIVRSANGLHHAAARRRGGKERAT